MWCSVEQFPTISAFELGIYVLHLRTLGDFLNPFWVGAYRGGPIVSNGTGIKREEKGKWKAGENGSYWKVVRKDLGERVRESKEKSYSFPLSFPLEISSIST